jgi:hypothetical protein
LPEILNGLDFVPDEPFRLGAVFGPQAGAGTRQRILAIDHSFPVAQLH